MARARTAAWFALAVLVASPIVVSPVVVSAPATPGATTGSMDSVEAHDGTETANTTDPTNQTESTLTPDDGADGHADDPFPRWLPVAFAGSATVGIAAVGGGL